MAHWSGAGVNRYDPEVWLLITEGLHVPLIPLLDTAGNKGAVEPAQIGPSLLNLGVSTGLDKTNTVFNSVVQPFASNMKSE